MLKLCVAALALSVAACSTRPPNEPAEVTLENQANAVLGQMRARDPGLDSLINRSAGYAVFPEIGAAGVILAGGAFGRGILYEHGVPTGYVSIKQGSVGPQLGGQTYSEMLVLRSDFDVQRLKNESFDLGADATAVALTAGAAASARFIDGTAVFVLPKGGLMAGVSVSGQKVDFEPRG